MIQKHMYQPGLNATCPKWDLIDIAFKADAQGDPFDVRITAEFNHKTTTLSIPAFYDGDNTWLVRFSPPDTGEWSFVTMSSVPTLSGHQGMITATAPPPAEHGPIGPIPGKPQRLQYADGTPYQLLAFEVDWLFALDAENPAGIPKAQSLIDYLVKNGINHAITNVFANDVYWDKDESLKPEHEYGAPSVFPFAGNNDEPDFSTLDVEYFQRFDRVMDSLRNSGIITHLMIYVWNKLVNWPDMYSRADNLYFDYVVRRYQAFPNMVWDISKEALIHDRCDAAYIHERISRIHRQDAYEHMITVHDYGYCAQYSETVDMLSVQTWQSGLYGRMREIAANTPRLPIFNIEHGGYERSPYVVFPGDYDDPEVCLARNYECVFAGTYSSYYWQGAAWNAVIHDPENLPEDQQPKFHYYKHLAEFLHRFDFSTYKPVEGRSSSGFCLSNDDDTWLYYLPEGTYATHIGINLLPEGTYQSYWFNPLTGEYTEPNPAEHAHWQEFLIPNVAQMWVLIIEKLT